MTSQGRPKERRYRAAEGAGESAAGEAFAKAQKRLRDKAARLPDAPGVYFFLRRSGKPKGAADILYIGRATSLRDRVRSYFSDDVIHTRGARIVDMVAQADDLDFVQADSVLEAIVLEANLIKKHQPRYNVDEKDDKSFSYVVVTDERFPRVILLRGKELEERRFGARPRWVFGPYVHGGALREGLRIVRRIFPYRDQRCVPCDEQLAQGASRCRACFNRQIGLCPGVCAGDISAREYGAIVSNLVLFFQGKKGALLRKLERQMRSHADRQEFEEALEAKRAIFALSHIQDVSLIKEEARGPEGDAEVSPGRAVPGAPAASSAAFRIEGYDVAHMSGKNMVGVMTVLEGREAKKSDYRMFKIRLNEGPDDTKALREILDRRLNHPEWPYPHLIVVDGGIAQKNAAEALLRERGFDIAVASVVKDDRHRPDRIMPGPGDAPKDDPVRRLAERHAKEILLVNSEAHRFAIKYHRSLRSRALRG